MLNTEIDPVTEIHRQLDFLKHLKLVGEGPRTIEPEIMKAHRLILTEFNAWLDVHAKDFPRDLTEFICEMFIRFSFMRSERRVYCPLVSGKRLQNIFLDDLTTYLRLQNIHRSFMKRTLDLFLKFRLTLKPTMH